MDLSKATIVADFGSGIGTEGSVLQIDNDNKRLGIGIDNPQAILQVGTGVTVYGNSGIVSATYFYGDASNITNTGSSLDAASGSQRVVVTSQTSGTMTAAATNGDLLFNASTNTLSAANVSIAGTLTYGDATNTDSVGIITARTGLKVTAGGINAVGVVTATSFSGDGSNLSGVESGVVNFVASGNIDNGKTVIIKDDGTVGIVTQTSVSTSAGTPTVFESGTANYNRVVYIGNDKVVVAYQDVSNSSYGTAVVGTISGTSISFGTPVVYESASSVYNAITYDSTNERVVIAYQDAGNSDHGTAIVGTVSGTSISFGTAVVFNAASSNNMAATYDSANGKVVIAYASGVSPYYGTAIVGTVSGTSISFGSAATFMTSGAANHNALVYDSTNGKVVVAYQDNGNSDAGTAAVGTVSGTSISFGTPVAFNATHSMYPIVVHDTANNKIVISYVDTNSGGSAWSKKGTAIVGTVSGTSISFGSAVIFDSDPTGYMASAYDSSQGKVVVAYNDEGNSEYGTAVEGTVSGTSISFGSAFVFESAKSEWISATYDSTNEKVVIAYRDYANSQYGTGVVYTTSGSSTNLTATNYIGIAGEAIANAATGKINIQGGTNTGQSGLTTAQTYYVGQTGILTTTADTPSVVAGTSISDTKILVR